MNFSREYSRCEESLERLTKEKKQIENKISNDTNILKERAIIGGISSLVMVGSIAAAILLTPLFLAVTFLTGYVAFKEISDTIFYKGEMKEYKEKLDYVNIDIENTEKYYNNIISSVKKQANNLIQPIKTISNTETKAKENVENLEQEL